MLLDIKGTIVNAFIEPQFEEVSSGHLVTVQFSDLDTLGRFKRHMQGDTQINLTDKYFRFTGHTELLDSNYHSTELRPEVLRAIISRLNALRGISTDKITTWAGNS
jgi:hypothetical protein